MKRARTRGSDYQRPVGVDEVDLNNPADCSRVTTLAALQELAKEQGVPDVDRYSNVRDLCLVMWIHRLLGDDALSIADIGGRDDGHADNETTHALMSFLYQRMGSPRRIAMCHGHAYKKLRGEFFMVDRSPHTRPDMVADIDSMIHHVLPPKSMDVIAFAHCPLHMLLDAETFGHLVRALRPGGRLEIAGGGNYTSRDPRNTRWYSYCARKDGLQVPDAPTALEVVRAFADESGIPTSVTVRDADRSFFPDHETIVVTRGNN